MRREKHKIREILPLPFGQIHWGIIGEILEKAISTDGNPAKEVAARIEKAQNAWKIVNIRLLRNKVTNPKIKLILWNSLIRSTMIY